MPFFKRNNNELLTAPNFVHAPGYSLTLDTKDDHAYPVDGWYWFDDLDTAMASMSTSSSTQSITMRQARLALLGADLLAGVDAAIASLPSPQKEAAQIEWEYAATVERNSPWVQNLAVALSLSSSQLDSLFEEAARL